MNKIPNAIRVPKIDANKFPKNFMLTLNLKSEKKFVNVYKLTCKDRFLSDTFLFFAFTLCKF